MMHVIRILFLLCLSGWISVAYAEPVLGSAPYSGDVAVARKEAVADALQNAALFNGVVVTALGRNDNGKTAESQQIHPVSTPMSYTLLREWREGGLYYVQIEPGKLATAPTPTAQAEPVGQKASSPAVQRPAECSGANYRRKVLVTPFWLSQPVQANDLSLPSQGFQRMLVDRLVDGGRFLAYSGVDELAFTPRPDWVDPQLRPEQVRLLARRYGVQFVMGGVVHDLSTSGVAYRAAYDQEVRPGERKLTLGLPLFDWVGVGVKAVPKSRQVDMEIYLFDGVSGALVTRHRNRQLATGQVMGRPDQATNSASFDQSDLGSAVIAALEQLAGQMAGDVACIPFSARVMRVEGQRLYFDAGTLSGIAPGDKLQLYRLHAGQVMQAVGGYEAQSMGMAEDLAGNVRVVQVQPLFSFAQFDGAQAEVGDYVRFVSSGKMP